jgi:dipeptidyl aminopeptidase/acylaminoacyl peptidase
MRKWLCVFTVFLFAALAAAQAERPAPAAGADEQLRRLTQLVEQQQFAIQVLDKKLTDLAFYRLAENVMRIEKVRYGGADGMIIPAYIFTPLQLKGPHSAPAVVVVHGGVHGDMPVEYFPHVKSFVQRGWVVIAPEYRGSTGYGREHYQAIDYGGKEVDDVLLGRDFLADYVAAVDPARIAILGWSHGGFITLHAIFRQPEKFRAGVDIVGVTDLVARMGYQDDSYRRTFSEQKGFGGTASQKTDVYLDRSPFYHAAELKIPLLIHAADNDQDVNILETRHLIDALKANGKTFEYEIYSKPPGGHMFNRIQTKQAQDSWNKILAFLEKNLK